MSEFARAKDFPSIKTDGKHILSYKEAMILDEIPKTLTIIGAGAIGVEFAISIKLLGQTLLL